MAIEIYDVSATLNNMVAMDQLKYQIEKDATITTDLISFDPIRVGFDPNGLQIEFVAPLAAPEKTALDALVAAHDGAGLTLQYSVQNKGEGIQHFETIYDALDAVTIYGTVTVPAQIITLTDTVTIPSYVLVRGEYGFDTTDIHVPFTDKPAFILSDNAKLEGVSIKYPDSTFPCVQYSGNVFAHCRDILLYGGTASSRGFLNDGLGALTLEGITHSSGDADKVITNASGQIQCQRFSLLSGNVFAAFFSDGGNLVVNAAAIAGLASVNYGMIINKQSEVDIGMVDFKFADKSFCYRNKKSKFRCRAGEAKGVTNSIEIDPLAYPYDPEGEFRFNGILDSSNISAPVGWDVDPKTTLDTMPF